MANKNRMEQPYGYREQNKFTSEPAMICEVISSKGGTDSEQTKKIEEILAKAFFDARYVNGKIIFSNSKGYDVDSVNIPLVDKATYDNETKKVTVTFKDGACEPIEIDLSDLVDQLEALVEEETEARAEEDEKLWDAIGEMGESGSSIIDLINEEASARTEADDEIWDAIGEMGESGKSIVERIEAEESARTEADEALEEALEEGLQQEAAERESADTEIMDALSAETEAREEADAIEASARTAADDALSEAISAETQAREEADAIEASARTEADDALSEAISAETEAREEADAIEASARTEADNALGERIDNEKAARIYWDGVLSGAIETERQERENGDNDLWGALNDEISARTEGDDALDGKIEQEKIDRAAADGELDGKILVEKGAREDADIILDNKIGDERIARSDADAALSGAIGTEKEEREAEDARIWEALSAETNNRISGDTALENEINNNKVSIVKVQSSLPSNIKEAFELKNTLGEILGDRINIYKDSSLKNVELTDHDDSGHTGQYLKFTYILDDGSEKEEYVDVSQFLVEAEFKDGLLVNNSGQVKVRIDVASEPYLTVSQNGVKLSGIDAISQALVTETTSRQNADTTLEAMIMNETTNRQVGDNDLLTAINSEARTRESADNDLGTRITNEASARSTMDSQLSTQISTEVANRVAGDQTLNNAIRVLNTSLSEETTNRVEADTSLQNQINDLKTADIEIRSSAATIAINLETEIANRTQADNNLQNQINTKANSVDVYYKDEADSIFATKEEIPTDFYTKGEVDSKDNEIKAMITAETSARESDDAELHGLISTEKAERISADTAINTAIDALSSEVNRKIEGVTTSDVSISVDNSNPKIPSIKLNISDDEGQIIALNADGIYAKSELEYDEYANILTFTNTNGTTDIQLKTKSEIDNIYYDKPNEEIVIEYTVNGQRKEDVRVPVGDLIEEWRPEDGNQGAIALTKDRSIQDYDVLKARLILNTVHTDNAAVIDDNALYVSKSAITADLSSEIEALKTRITALEQSLSAATADNSRQDESITQLMGYHQNDLNP